MRIATPLLAALVWLGASVPTASAGDALTTSTTRAVSKGLLGSLFRKKNSDESTPVTGATAMDRINRSILGLPFGILKSLGKGISRAATKTVTDHITHN